MIIVILLELSLGLPEHLPQNSLCCVQRIVTGATLTMTNGKGGTGKGDPGQGDLSKRSTRASVVL